jgi:hypothetical protein
MSAVHICAPEGAAMTRAPAKLQRRDSAFGIRISDAARAKLHVDAERQGLSVGRYLEELIMEGRLAQTDFFAQQAAVSAFTAAALSASIAAKILSPQETAIIQERGSQLAAQMFGARRRRPEDVGPALEDSDPRVMALFEAFCPR